jgi:hypothetical protein
MSTHALSPTDPTTAIRFVDVALVIAAAPFVIVAGLPVLGYAVAAVAWTLQRFAAVAIDKRARQAKELRSAIGLNIAALMARVWFVGLAILTVGLAGTDDDGLMAAVICLIAFTMYFAMSLLMRSLEKQGSV